MKCMNWMSTACLVFLMLMSGCIIDLDDDNYGPCERGRGTVITEVIDLPYFDGVVLEISGNVFITQGPQLEVVVESYPNLIDRLETRVRNNVWEIDLEGCTRNPDDIDIFITMPDVRLLEVTGSGVIVSQNVLVTNDIDLVINGSGAIDVALDVDDVFAEINGSGDIYLEGRGDELFYGLLGSGDLRAFDCNFNEARIRVSGSGDTEVFINEFLNVEISGSGDVFFRGNPIINLDVSGSGDLIDAN